jgi:hypothetical protein
MITVVVPLLAGVHEDCRCLPVQLDHNRVLLLSNSSSLPSRRLDQQQQPLAA